MSSFSADTEEVLPPYIQTLHLTRRQRYEVVDIPPFQGGDGDLPPYNEDRSPPRYLRQIYHVAEIPPFRGTNGPRIPLPAPHQDHPDFPFHLPPDGQMHISFRQKDKDTILVLPFGSTDEDRPLYTIRRRITQNIPRGYTLDVYRNHNRQPVWYNPENPMASISVHKNPAFLNLRVSGSENTKTSIAEFVHNDILQSAWRFPRASWSPKRPGCSASSRLYARLCRIEDDNKVVEEFRRSIVDVLIWDGKGGLCHGNSFVRIAMREILDERLQREAQVRRMDEIVTLVVRFCAGRLQFAGRVWKHCSH